jgi:hypothetical protein
MQLSEDDEHPSPDSESSISYLTKEIAAQGGVRSTQQGYMPTNLNNFSSYKSTGRAFPTQISCTLGTNEKPRGEAKASETRLNVLRS